MKMSRVFDKKSKIFCMRVLVDRMKHSTCLVDRSTATRRLSQYGLRCALLYLPVSSLPLPLAVRDASYSLYMRKRGCHCTISFLGIGSNTSALGSAYKKLILSNIVDPRISQINDCFTTRNLYISRFENSFRDETESTVLYLFLEIVGIDGHMVCDCKYYTSTQEMHFFTHLQHIAICTKRALHGKMY